MARRGPLPAPGVALGKKPPRDARPLLHTADHGPPIVVSAEDLGLSAGGRSGHDPGTDWVEPFLEANRDPLERLALTPEVRIDRGGTRLALHPGARLGAAALRSPVTRKVTAGLLVRSRFGWERTGQVLGATAWRVEPTLGGGPLVPGSAREVPPYVIAGPVLSRLSELIARMTRGFLEVTEDRTRPRGHVDWTAYGRRSLPTGDWQRFRCTFPDLSDDPLVLSAIRWTLRRLVADLERTAESPASRALLEVTHRLTATVGPGPELRPAEEWLRRAMAGRELGEWLIHAIEGMCWVAEERGLGGLASLDGLPWSLDVDRLWEAWVESFVAELAPRLGARLEVGRRGETTRPLLWESGPRSLGHLVPDLALRWPDRTVWIDAKYKRHLAEIAALGWSGVREATREAHRADVHQALAYATLAPEGDVDTVLAYPAEGDEVRVGVAQIASGRRSVKLVLAGVPFGFRASAAREIASLRWEQAFGA